MVKIDKSKFKNFYADHDLMNKWAEKYFPLSIYCNDERKQACKFFDYYTGNFDMILNSKLRTGGDVSDVFNDYGELVDKNMYKNALELMHDIRIPENIVVYREVSKSLFNNMIDWSGETRLRRSITIWDKALLSTSLDMTIRSPHSSGRGRTKMIIYVPQGTPGIYVGNLPNRGVLDEHEIIFPPELKMQVLSTGFFGKYVECMVV